MKWWLVEASFLSGFSSDKRVVVVGVRHACIDKSFNYVYVYATYYIVQGVK
jgi:hypothetical protein